MAVSNFDQHGERFGPGTAYAEPSPGHKGLVKVLLGAVALLAVTAVGWVAWIAYDEGVRAGAVKTVPVIKADTNGVKRKPDDPGGLVVPHQDKLVFNRLAPGRSDEPVERLLPLPEAPIALPAAQTSEPPAQKALPGGPAAPETEIATALTPILVEPPAEKLAPESTAAPPPPAEPAAPAAAPPPAATVAAPPAVEPATEIAAVAGWRIQLVALSSHEAAEAAWTRLQKANGDLLGELALQVETAKLAKGTFFRVQAGPLPDREAAAALCGRLKSRNQDCLVVAP